MAFCRRCGNEIKDDAKFCHACGMQTEPIYKTAPAPAPTPVAPIVQTPTPEKSSGVLKMSILIWSLLNLLSCCAPLGIAGLILTILAKDASTAEEETKKLKSAKVCNLIATIFSVIVIVIYALYIWAIISEF